MTYVIAQPCVDLKDKACIEECPVDCIYEGERMLYIHPDECVDCGACEPVCPVEAIFYEDDVPEQWKDYYKANVEFFDDLGCPGGAAKVGRDPQGPPAHRRAAAAGARRVGAPIDGPWLATCRTSRGTARALRREGAGPRGRHRRPLGRHPGRPDAGADPARARRGGRRPRLPADLRHARPARGRRRVVRPAPRRARPRPGRSAADHRLQGAGGAAADAARARGRATSSSIPRWPTRRTTWAPGSPAPSRSRPTARLSWSRWPRGSSWSGSTRRPTRPGGCWARRTWPRSSPGPVSTARSWPATSATPSWPGGRARWSATHRPRVPSILDPEVCGGSHEGLLAVYSLSKQSNLAGYRAAFVAGDVSLVRRLLEVRKHAGLIVPGPVQAAMIAALGDDEHVADATRPLRRRRAAPAAGARGGRLRGRPLAGRVSTSGRPAARTAGRRSSGWPSAASWSRPAPSTAPPAPARAGRPDRDRRDGRGRGDPAHPRCENS